LDFVSVAFITKTRGVKGELAADLLTDFPKRFSLIRQVRILRGEQVFEETLEKFWFLNDRVILKFEGKDSPEAARILVGGYVQVPEDQRFPLPRNTYYHSDLIDCSVKTDAGVIGVVTGVFEGGENENLVVRTPDDKEVMIPMVRDFVTRVDVKHKLIHVRLLPGLLD